eukprot:scaffold16359_cov123-Skeletonema_dohrnii-CCMP3373.AAC.1
MDRNNDIVRYDMAVTWGACGDKDGLIRSPTPCSDADTTNQCLSRGKDASIPSWPTIMGH